jgi:hypothetical protein
VSLANEAPEVEGSQLRGPDQRLNQELETEILVEAIPASVAPAPSWLRLAYSLEFLIALIAVMNLWSEIGGEGHLDLMPWPVKLVCIVGLAWCSVRFTAGIVESERFWTRRSVRWFAGILLFCIAMGGITFYYHLNEESDEGDDDTGTAMLNAPAPGNFSL